MKALECVSCGARFTPDHKREWGRDASSDGAGPRASCTALVPDPYAPKAPDGSTPAQLCRGDLLAVEIPDAEAATVAPRRPIAPGARR